MIRFGVCDRSRTNTGVCDRSRQTHDLTVLGFGKTKLTRTRSKSIWCTEYNTVKREKEREKSIWCTEYNTVKREKERERIISLYIAFYKHRSRCLKGWMVEWVGKQKFNCSKRDVRVPRNSNPSHTGFSQVVLSEEHNYPHNRKNTSIHIYRFTELPRNYTRTRKRAQNGRSSCPWDTNPSHTGFSESYFAVDFNDFPEKPPRTHIH